MLGHGRQHGGAGRQEEPAQPKNGRDHQARFVDDVMRPPRATDGKVLVVDDEASVLEVVRRCLSRHGFQCRLAANAQEALAAAAVEPPILAILDVRMPGRDGIWLLEQFKERWPDTAVIMLTAVSEVRTAVECLRQGADDYLTKPIDLEELSLSARRAIEKIQLVRENREYSRNLAKMVKERTANLTQVLGVIEQSYQSTLGALVDARRMDRHDLEGAATVQLRDAARAPASQQHVQSRLDEQASKSQVVELTALRSAGELIGQGASPLELASALATELVDHGGARFARLWLQSRQAEGLEVVVEKGARGAPGLQFAKKAASSGVAHVEQQDDALSVSVPILVQRRAEGVLQIGWKDRGQAEPVALTQRLALFLAASLARERDAEDWRKTARELDLFSEMAGATRYAMDIQHLAEFIMGSVHRIVEYDVAGLVLLDEPVTLNIQTRFPADEDFINRVRTHILNTLRLTYGVETGRELDTRVSRVETPEEHLQQPPHQLRSFVNVPLTVGGTVVGLIHVSTGRENAFTQEDIVFLNRAANFLAKSVQGVRDILATVKGQLEKMVEHMTDGVLMLDRRGQVVAMNEAARQIFRLGSTLDRRVDATQLAKVLKFDPMALMRAKRRSLRKVVCVHGIVYQAQLSPIEGSPRELSGVVMAFRNYTQEKKIDEMKSDFINVVSHELRTPLTATKNAIALLAGPRLGDLNSNQSRFLNMAQRNIEELIGMVNDLLDLSKIEAGKMQIALEPVALNEPMERGISSLYPQAEEKRIALDLAIAPDLPRVYGDSASIQRVLVNLVGNALKFTDGGGKVRVEASRIWEESETGRRPAVKVTVSDTGVGIPKEQLTSIFDRFHQVDSSRSRGGAGTGLGLPITRELIKAHHGRIWAESEPGRGSRFFFVIPVLTEGELFFRTLDQDLDRSARTISPLAVLVVVLVNAGKLKARLGGERYSALLDTIEAAARDTVRRATDRVVLRRERAELVVVLPDTAREGGKAFSARLLGEIETASAAGVEVKLTGSIAVFPEDATSAEKLYEVALDGTDVGATAS
ncbi:MAG: ATP-binding protein [Acidobacteriota bacterium]